MLLNIGGKELGLFSSEGRKLFVKLHHIKEAKKGDKVSNLAEQEGDDTVQDGSNDVDSII